MCYPVCGKPATKNLTERLVQMKIGLSSLSLFPLFIKKVLRLASQSGFDFVEVFLLGRWTKDEVARTIGVAALLGLELHWHEVWTTESSEAQEKRVNQALTLLGLLPPDGYRRDEWVPRNARPLVAYADDISLFVSENDVWFQSIACQKSLADPSPRLSRREFFNAVRRKKCPVVLDTIHYIEYLRNESGIERSVMQAREILAEWSKFWVEFNSQVREIHWNDFSTERNLWPGTGIAPLKEFGAVVAQSGWDGCIVPEVRPRLPFPYGSKELLALRKKMDEYFG